MIIASQYIAAIRSLVTTQPNLEIEARFGTYTSRGFTNGVHRRTFVRLKNIATQIDPKFSFSHTLDQYYSKFVRVTTVYPHSVHNGVRTQTELIESMQRLSIDQPTQFATHKTRLRDFNIPEYNVRISVSKEESIDQIPTEQPTSSRNKKRWSFSISGLFRLDLTEATITQHGQTSVNYEVELELLKDTALDSFDAAIQSILRGILDTNILYTQTEKNTVISRINRALGSQYRDGITAAQQEISERNVNIDFQILSQARNLKARDLVVGGIVPKTNRDIQYSVTIKADGIRKLLVIDPNGIYLAMAPDELNKIFTAEVAQTLQTWHGTIVEGELIPRSSLSAHASDEERKLIIYFLMFDCLSVSYDPSVRDITHPERLKYLFQLQRAFSQLTKYRFDVKEFFVFANIQGFYHNVNYVLDKYYPFKTDGILFTPSNYRYDSSTQNIPLVDRVLTKHPDICKWKPVDQLTIDFIIRHVSTGGETTSKQGTTAQRGLLERNGGKYIELLSNDPIRRESVPFTGTKQYPFDPITQILYKATPPIRDETVGIEPQSVPNEIEAVKLITDAPTGTIVEFRWDTGLDKLVATRIRSDKFIPNNLDIAKDVWQDIHTPLDEETIRGQKFSLIFRYHNREKMRLFEYVGMTLSQNPTSSSRTLLSIGAGRGGDINKWIAAKFTHVICVEPNEENRLELQRRLKGRNIEARIVPTIGQDVETIVKNVRDFAPNGIVDTISYMLSLSFFFDKSESIKSIIDLTNETLRPGGYFISFSIDGRYVVQFFNDPRYYTETNGVKHANFKMIDFELRPSTTNKENIGFPTIYINIPGSIVETQTEYLTNLPDLYLNLENIGLKMIEEKRAMDERFMTNEELYFTQMFTSSILQRI